MILSLVVGTSLGIIFLLGYEPFVSGLFVEAKRMRDILLIADMRYWISGSMILLILVSVVQPVFTILLAPFLQKQPPWWLFFSQQREQERQAIVEGMKQGSTLLLLNIVFTTAWGIALLLSNWATS